MHKVIIVLTSLFMCFSSSYGHDLGNYGAVFEIKEPDLLVQIQKRLQQFSPDEIAYHQQQLAKKMHSAIESPKAAKYLPRTVRPRTFTFDPSFTLDKDYTDAEGNLIAIRGTTINPLDHLTYDKELIFIDGTDRSQVKWLKSLTIDNTKKVILVDGKPFDLERELGEPVYFDQQAFMVNKFGIQAVPAIVKQEGQAFTVNEVLINE